MIDFFGWKSKLELDAARSSHIAIEAARTAEVQRLGQLLNSTLMKLLAVTDKDAARMVSLQEKEPKEQGPVRSPIFMRRGGAISALNASREAANGA